MERLLGFLHAQAADGLLAWAGQVAAAHTFGVSLADVERTALANGLLPLRYQRNRAMISCHQQLRFFNSVVAVIGCGGLGGYIIEELARLGVGQIVAVDPDVFEESNLNRQLFSSLPALGRAKVAVAAERVGQINPAIRLDPRAEAFTAASGERLLEGVHLAVDALDSLAARLALAAACRAAGIPLIHGAIAGWYGQITTQFPGETTLESLYQGQSADRGIEKQQGNPSFTPAVIASLEVAEVCKLLLGEGQPLRGRILTVDLRDMEFVETVVRREISTTRA